MWVRQEQDTSEADTNDFAATADTNDPIMSDDERIWSWTGHNLFKTKTPGSYQ